MHVFLLLIKFNLSEITLWNPSWWTETPLFCFLALALIKFGWQIDHDAVIKCRHFPRYWPFVRGIHRWIPLTKASDAEFWCFLICAWTNGWVNYHETGDLRRHCAYYDVTVKSLAVTSMCSRGSFHPMLRWWITPGEEWYPMENLPASRLQKYGPNDTHTICHNSYIKFSVNMKSNLSVWVWVLERTGWVCCKTYLIAQWLVQLSHLFTGDEKSFISKSRRVNGGHWCGICH